ncbi:enhancer of split m4 protein-like [Musca vetustissima]|uniref:enhancer of split m4 protein-like n=1 Tax=Musca vetustissima TaxID=27455 RepID=UPI002AB79BCE|nr:enhancer of split m4 protein-like [Musca vetustissima]
MFVDNSSNKNNKMEIIPKKFAVSSYSVKKLMKQLFKQHKSKHSQQQQLGQLKKSESFFEALESLENQCNAKLELEAFAMETEENNLNERLAAKQKSYELEDYDFSQITVAVPVHFARTNQGTFFWTTSSDIPSDNDLVQPMSCSTNNQLPSSM